MARTPAGQARGKIIAAAYKLFAERGYKGASTHDIAKAAKVSGVTVFRIFGSKRCLFIETVRFGFSGPKFLSEVTAALQQEDDIQAFRDGLDAFVRLYIGNKEVLRLMLFATLENPSGLLQMLEGASIPITRAFMARYSQAVENGTFRDVQPVAAARALFGIFFYYHLFQPIRMTSKEEPAFPHAATKLFDVWLNGVLA